MMTKKLIEQMLEALQYPHSPQSWYAKTCKEHEAITSAREYLAAPEQLYGWLTACDEEMTCAHLGVANLSDSYDSAKAKLNSLIDWHITVATDPAVNGGLSLQPEQSELESAQRSSIYWMERNAVNCRELRDAQDRIAELTAPPLRELTPEEIDAVLRKVGILANLETLREIAYAVLAAARKVP
jgi:hypothetical protein